MCKKSVILSLLMVLCANFILAAQTNEDVKGGYFIEKPIVELANRPVTCYDVKVTLVDSCENMANGAFKVHPLLGDLYKGKLKDSLRVEVQRRIAQFDTDTYSRRDIIYILQPIFGWAHSIDPHFRINQVIDAPSDKESMAIYKYIIKKQRQLPLTLCNINDSLIIYKSLDPQFQSGDIVTSINGVSSRDYLKYNYYEDRFTTPFNLMLNHDWWMVVTANFDVEIIRNGKPITISTEGFKPSKMFVKDSYNVQAYSDYNCGYICIKEFFYNNSHLIKRLRGAIEQFKEQGIENIIIDVRENPGGYGSNFDELLSIFTDKQSIQIGKGQKLRVSEFTLDYDFASEDMIGMNVEFPNDQFHKEIPLNPELYIDGMNYYILASKDTSSTAAMFVNLLDYNDMATICGEPLRRGALSFGETLNINGKFAGTNISPSGICTVKYDEYSNAIDDTLHPDIFIPYVAEEYTNGTDAVLLQLLQIIKGGTL